MRAIRIHRHGGPEVLTCAEVPQPEPDSDEVLIRNEVVGVNFVDVYQRRGWYTTPVPVTIGVEGAGTVMAAGSGVVGLPPGTRVAYHAAPGAYAEFTLAKAAQVVPVPEQLTAREAGAVLLQGITAHSLTTSTYALGPNDWCLVHAAAGGVGRLLCQIARLRGARVIGTVSTDSKAVLAREVGAEGVIVYTREDFPAAVQRITGGTGVQVVYDSVGRDTFTRSLDCLAPRGTLVLFGQSSGPVDPVDPQVLNRKGSLYLTRPTLAHYVATREELAFRASEVFSWVIGGMLSLRVDVELPLEQAAEAHRRLEERRTSGKVLLIP